MKPKQAGPFYIMLLCLLSKAVGVQVAAIFYFLSLDRGELMTRDPPSSATGADQHSHAVIEVSSSTLSEQLGFGDIEKQSQARFCMQHEYNPVFFHKQDTGTYDAAPPININSKVATEGMKCVSMQRYHHNGDTELPTEVPMQAQQLPKGDQAGRFPRTGTGRPIEDGYNWKKYGQKQVKGSEYPRSYYKCTHPTCLVKKNVEHALDGQIREIIYRGSHNHPAPQGTLQSAFASSHAPNNMIQDSAEDPNSHWRFDGQEMTPSASNIAELSDALSGSKRKNSGLVTDEHLSALTCEDDDKNGDMQGSMLHGDDGEFDEPEAKRKKEYCLTESTSASRAIRESRIVVQTVSDVDILEDGYRWRKYGQKVVKGNPNPRSYYKCTHPGCLVRKHIERAPDDLRSVITTYEGKHNHEVPTARTSNDIGSGGNSQLPPNAHNPVTAPGYANVPKPEPQMQDFVSCFENNLEFCGNYLKQRYPGSVLPFSSVQLPLLPSFPLSHMMTAQHTCQDLPFPFHTGIGSSNSVAASYELSQASSNIPAYQYHLSVQVPNVGHTSIPRLMKKEMLTHDSPDSPLSPHTEFLSPPYE